MYVYIYIYNYTCIIIYCIDVAPFFGGGINVNLGFCETSSLFPRPECVLFQALVLLPQFLIYGGFLKWGTPKSSILCSHFPLQTIHFGDHPFMETPIWVLNHLRFLGHPKGCFLPPKQSPANQLRKMGVLKGPKMWPFFRKIPTSKGVSPISPCSCRRLGLFRCCRT